MAHQLALRTQRPEHSRRPNSGHRVDGERWGLRLWLNRLGHRLDVDRLEARLLLFELVKGSAMLGEAALQLRGERGAIPSGRIPGERVSQALVFEPVVE